MDGVTGLTQPPIQVGKTFVYEFVLQRSGTFMYHPHADEMTQMAMGMMGSSSSTRRTRSSSGRPRLRLPPERL
jgi:FtsP/CotA-like multicopper oxidase with cupredoxin domain